MSYSTIYSGYLTPEGFHVKKARLDCKYTDKEEGDSSSVAETLAKPTSPTREKLMHLFKSKSDFNPSRVSSMLSSGPKSKPPKQKRQALSKRLTIIDCGTDVLTVPKEKVRSQLRAKKRLNQIVLTELDSTDAVKEKVMKAFPHFGVDSTVVFLSPTQSHDLFPSEVPEGCSGWDGDAVLKLYGNGIVFVKLDKMVAIPKCTESPKVQAVQPVYARIVPSQVLKGNLKV